MSELMGARNGNESRRLVAVLDDLLFPVAPASRLAAMRILVGAFATVYLLARAPHLTSFGQFSSAAFRPVGPVALLTEPLSSVAVFGLFTVALISAVLVTLGHRHAVTGPVFGVALLWVLSYRNSWGMIFHTENLLVMHALVIGIAPAADAWRVGQRSRDIEQPTVEPSRRYGWALRLLAWITIVSYVIAGIAKLRAAGWAWTAGGELRSHIAFDAVRKLELGSIHSALGAALVPYAWVFTPLAWLTLLLELGAPLALLGRRWALWWSLLAWSFHVGVLLLMVIVFPYPLIGLAYAPLFRLEHPFERWVWPWLGRLRR